LAFFAYRLAAAATARLSSIAAMALPDPLITRLKHLVVSTLKLEDVTPAQMADDEPLIGSGLNLDSIDALELVVTLEKEFGIKISSSEESRQALASIAHLAEYIRNRADPARLPA
jgi:acyl carrier protein